ncbi:DUF1707 domain-containing protein [Nocardia sp. NBC_00511]|uniref:DUF1707 SHOCT-like domain-containing protein n=1 Tax=Nocardia sp. NBC_00511 TaxID=2903591 RepID=UPI0030E03236
MTDMRSQLLRARDSDRVDACTLLDAARDSGELSADEHAQRTSKAMAAKLFGELDDVLRDLQIPRNLVNSPVVRPDRRTPSTRWRLAVIVLAVAAVVGGFAGCVAHTAAPKPPLPDPTTGAGLASFVAAYQAHFGDTKADQVLLFPTYVMVDRRSTPDTGRDASIRYDGGFSNFSDSARSSGEDTFDLAALDLRKLAALLAGAPESAGVPGGQIAHIGIERGADGGPEVSVYVDAAGGQSRGGWFKVTAKGEPIAIYPPS